MQKISVQMQTDQYSEAISRFSREHPNLQKLLTDVMYSTTDTYRMYISLAETASQVLQKFMGGEMAFLDQ